MSAFYNFSLHEDFWNYFPHQNKILIGIQSRNNENFYFNNVEK